ncbi:MAG: hypothetical protein AAF788_05390 [Pseudomonadota bacterium]
MAEQAALPFAPRVITPAPYRPSPDQEEATRTLRQFARRFGRAESGLTAVVLDGPSGSGKSRLVQELGGDLDGLPLMSVDVQETAPMELFAAINACASAREMLVIEAREPMDGWLEGANHAPLDLVSRLQSVPRLHIDRPSAEALIPILSADLLLHGYRLSQDDVSFVTDRLPRHFSAPRQFCQNFDCSGAHTPRRERLQWALERVHVASHT